MDRTVLTKNVLDWMIAHIKNNHEIVLSVIKEADKFTAVNSTCYDIVNELCNILANAMGADNFEYHPLCGNVVFSTWCNNYTSKIEIAIHDLVLFFDENFK